MLFALPILLLVCLPSICGNEVIDKNKEFNGNNNNTHFVSAANRPLQQRNQTKVTRDDQLLSLLASRRRQILQNRFKSHIQNIVEISNGSTVPTIPKNIQLPNNTKSINVHLNLSDLLKNSEASTSEENLNQSNASTESNVINVSSPRTTNKPTRKNVEPPQIPENKNVVGKTANMPIIRNILYRRKMSYLNRKLPLDFEQIAFDTLGISEINKNPEDLIFDNEDSLQVEESSHDKLIYYDVKNNSSKKSGNNFEDTSDEIKTMSMMNKTFNTNKKNITIITTTIGSAEESNESSTNSSNLDDIDILLNTTEATTTTTKTTPTTTTHKIENKTEETKMLYKNNTRFMSPSLYNYFRPLDVPEEEMQPFLHFGEKLPSVKPSQSPKLPEKKKPEEIQRNEEEIHENMDVLAEKSVLIENKITKMNLPNQKVNAARDYYKSRNQNKNLQKNTTETPSPQKQKTVAQLRNTTRNRGFRNQTIFYQNKRNGMRQTINLRGNVTLSDLKPSTVVTEITTSGTPVVSSTEKLKIVKLAKMTAENTTEVVTPQSKSPETSTLSIVSTTKVKSVPQTSTPVIETKTPVKNDDLLTSSTKYLVDSTTSSVPTTRILSTAVVTSVSVQSKQKNATKAIVHSTENKVQTTTDINDSDATVVAALSNFTLQAFQNNTKINNTTSSRNPATVYPSIDIPVRNISNAGNSGLYAHHLEYAVPQQINVTKSTTTPRVQTTQTTPKTKFILRPNKRTRTQQPTQQEMKSTTTEFVINVEDDDQTDAVVETTKLDLETTTPTKVQIDSRFGFEFGSDYESTTAVPVTTTSTTATRTTTTTISSSTIPSTTPTSTTTTSSTTTTPTTTTTTSTTTEEPLLTTTKAPNRTFNTTMLTKPDTESELPLATLFSVTDFKKPENQTRLSPAIETVISRKSENEVSLDNIHAAYILAALGFLPMMVIVIYVVRSLMKKKHKNIEDFEAEMHHDSEKKSIIHPVARLPTLVLDTSNRWEFPRGKLRLQTLLGQGNFGQVWKAEADDLKGHVGLTRLVAVKTIKDGAGSKERDDLLKELAIMQKMGSHPNVVTLLGCCTDKEPYLLIMEYVMYGKLLTFLRDHRTRRDYYNFSDDAATLTARDLTVFAYCVARGMEYLSSKGIIHRDLAARNILVDHNKLCKIADFGMSRDVGSSGEINEPRQPRNALPVRWMAIESLMYSVFSSKSDVWAFGVLLWEIVTLGSSPYANMSGREVMRLVCEGYRLERPSHCRPELYRVMANTWSADAAQRPTFAELRADLAALLDTAPAEGSYVDLESFRADSTVYEIDNCTPRGNYFTVKSRFSEFECDI